MIFAKSSQKRPKKVNMLLTKTYIDNVIHLKKKMNMKKMTFYSLSILSLLLLACGDSSTTEVTQIIAGDFKTVDSKEDLPECTNENEGNYAYVTSLSQTFICAKEEWMPMAGNISSAGCSVSENKDGSATLSCPDGSSVVIQKGKDGTNGEGGSAGGCSVSENEDGSFTLACSDGSSVVIPRGKDGENGTNGSSAGTVAQLSISDSIAKGYANTIVITVNDVDLLEKKDTVQVTVMSASDKKGITLDAIRDGIYYKAELGFAQTSKKGFIAVKDGDSIHVSYQDNNPSILLESGFVWKDYIKQSSGVITLDRTVFVGENAKANVVLVDGDLTDTLVAVTLSIAGITQTIQLRGSAGVYSSSLTLSSKTSKPENGIYKVSDGNIIKVTYNDKKPTGVSIDSAYWYLARQGYVQFSSDKYQMLTSNMIYVYDDDNLDSTCSVTISSELNTKGIEVKLSRTGDYFYGSFQMSLSKGSAKTLLVQDGGIVSVTYKDESTGKSATDQVLIDLTKNISLQYAADVYRNYDDKAVVTLSDYSLGLEDVVYAQVWSTSDANKKSIELHPTYGNTIGYSRVGFVEFVSTNANSSQLKVADGDMIYVMYQSTAYGLSYQDSAYWTTCKPPTANGSMTDARDNKKYKTVDICGVTWMAQNLNYEVETFSLGNDEIKWSDNPSFVNYKEYGRLYSWSAAIDSVSLYKNDAKECGYRKSCLFTENVQGVCPNGWHLPSLAEWRKLLRSVAGESFSSGLIATTDWSSLLYAKNTYLFNAYPTGYSYSVNSHSMAGTYTYFWTSTESDANNSNAIVLNYYNTSYQTQGKNCFLPVRCVKN